MKNAVILHGTNGSPQDNWFQWLKKELETIGYQVWVPELPDNARPDSTKYNKLLLNSDFNYNDETLLIGHSSGAVAALQLLQALPKVTKVKGVYLIGIFKDNLGWMENKEFVLQKILEPELNFPEIRKKSSRFVLIHSTDDPHCPVEHASYMAVKLGGELIITHGQKHFSVSTAGENYREFPMLKELILAREQ